MFRAKVGVEAKGHLKFVERFRSQAREQDLMQTLEGVMVALEPAHAFLDGEAGFHRVLHRANACQRGQILVGFVNAHSQSQRKSETRIPKLEKKFEKFEFRNQSSRSECEPPHRYG